MKTCEAPNCQEPTSNGKPYCVEHLLMEDVAQRTFVLEMTLRMAILNLEPHPLVQRSLLTTIAIDYNGEAPLTRLMDEEGGEWFQTVSQVVAQLAPLQNVALTETHARLSGNGQG